MPVQNIIRVFEFEKLYYDETTAFKKRHWEALCQYLQSANSHTCQSVPYFQIIHKGIRFTNYVGVIQAGNLTIEILPKIDKSTVTAVPAYEGSLLDEGKQQWHYALLQMLSECRFLKIHPAAYAHLRLENSSLLTIYIDLFLTEAEKLIHDGLLKNYEQQEINQTALKGQLLLHKQVQRNSVHAERFYTRSTAFNTDNVFNQILYKALWLVRHISAGDLLADKADCLLAHFPTMSAIIIMATTFDQLVYNRKTSRYQEVIGMAKLLLLGQRPTITGGTIPTIAILFDMNALWEEWIYWRLKKEETTFGITVQRQQTANFWEAPHLAKPKTIRPDIIIQKGTTTITLDTKWKLLQNSTPADDDLKQLFVYNLYWQCGESILLYPAINETKSVSGQYIALPGIGSTVYKCLVLTQSIFTTKGQLNPLLGKEILQKVLVKHDLPV